MSRHSFSDNASGRGFHRCPAGNFNYDNTLCHRELVSDSNGSCTSGARLRAERASESARCVKKRISDRFTGECESGPDSASAHHSAVLPADARARHSRLSIALLCESFGALGGVAQIVEELATEFAAAGHRVAIVSNPHKGALMPRRHNQAVEQIWLDLPRAKPLSLRHLERLWRRPRASALAAFFRRWTPDLVNIHGGLRDRFPAVLTACHQTKVPIVQSFHLVPEPFSRTAEDARLNRFSNRALIAARAITFPSIAVKEGFKKITPVAEGARIIRGGVSFEQAARAAPHNRPRPYIFSASRLDLRHKAVDQVIGAFRLLAPEFPEVDLLIAGDGPQRGQVGEMIARSAVEERIQLMAPLPHDELWSFYKGALVFIMLSRMEEGLPLVFFEAMACSTPVVGTRSGGTPEIVIHQENGLLVESNETDVVADALRRLLTDAGLRKQMGQSGCQRAKAYDWRETAAAYLKLYQGLFT